MKNISQFIVESGQPTFSKQGKHFGILHKAWSSYSFVVIDTLSDNAQFYENTEDIIRDWGEDDDNLTVAQLNNLDVPGVMNCTNFYIFKFA